MTTSPLAGKPAPKEMLVDPARIERDYLERRPSYFGTIMVHFGEADGMVSGSVHTTQYTIRPAFEIIKTRPGCSIVSSVFFMCLSDHVLVFGDCAVNPDPNSEQLADIAISSAETARMFGIDPFIAMLSYSTGESGEGAETSAGCSVSDIIDTIAITAIRTQSKGGHS